MSTKIDRMSLSSRPSDALSGSRQLSISSQPLLSVVSSPKSGGEALSNAASLEDSPADNLDWVLDHCFKQFKIREAYPHFFLKVKASRFGPPRSRRRILIAPPMGEMAVGGPRPHPPELPAPEQKPVGSGKPPEVEEKTSSAKEEAELQELEAWMEGRVQLENLLNCVDLEQWLMEKQPVSEQEQNVLRMIQEQKEALKTKVQAKLWEDDALEEESFTCPFPSIPLPNVFQNVRPKPPHKIVIPRISAPYPKSLMTLQNLLHKHKIKLVDLFKKADRSKTRFKRDDFIKIIQETNIPFSKTDLEDVITYLMMSKKVNYISSDDLVECQRLWAENLREQWRQPKESKSETEELPPSTPQKPCRKSVTFSKHSGEAKICRLEVPPINTEVDRMHLTYNQMEEAGKRYREMRRRAKRKTNPLEYAEQCRLVRSGDAVVDGHCFPSTIQGEMGELVDQHRLACHLVYTQCLKLCQKYGIPLTEKMLKRALLYPPDKIVREGNYFRKMRQPGGYYDQSRYQPKLPSEEPRSTSGGKKRKKKAEVKKPEVQKTDNTLKTRWKSYKEFWKLMRPHSKKVLPPDSFLNSCHLTLDESMGILVEQYVERELRKMFDHLNPKTDPNNFWPGHLLSKLRLFLPMEARDTGDAIFSHVPRTYPAYPARYNPDRSWPLNRQGYVSYGDPGITQKRNYYI